MDYLGACLIMCGIACKIDKEAVSAERIEQALVQMKTRGPDASGLWRSPSGNAILGHCRLAIIGLDSTANQPLASEDGTVRVVCNGEIYNYPSLRTRLEDMGHEFRTSSDNEAIVHAYEQWGKACLNELEGMFAFVLWDESEQMLFAARDRVGIKPLCFAVQHGGIAVASHFGGLLPLMNKSPNPNPLAVAYVFAHGYVPAPHSIWDSAHKLPGGHWLSWKSGEEARVNQYWQPPEQTDSQPQDREPSWEELFGEIVQEHLLSDVPVGLFLSGGIDSTSIAAALSERGKALSAFTVTFPDGSRDEGPIARAVANHLGLDHHCQDLKMGHVLPLMDRVAKDFDEPQGYSALMTLHEVSRLAAQHYKVVLAGDGGDECFGGYRWYFEPSALEVFRSRVRSLLRPRSENQDVATEAIGGFGELASHARLLFPCFSPEQIQQLLRNTGVEFGQDQWLEPLRQHDRPNLPRIRRFQRIDLMTFCADSILPKVDRASMASSLEVRVPFLDRRIIEWAFRRPPTRRDSLARHSKKVLRNYLRTRVPHSVLNHPKQGFSMPFWNTNELDRSMQEIEQSWWVQSGFFGTDWRSLVADEAPMRRARLFVMLSLVKWGQHWLNKTQETQ